MSEQIDSRPPGIGHWLPWAECNLRRNPFGELTQQERAEVAVVNVEQIAARARTAHAAVQLMGGNGRGKTTRMLVLLKQFPNACYVCLPEEGPCPAIAEGSPLLIDEAQRLSKAACRSVFVTGLPLVLATHRDLSRMLRRFQYDVYTESIGGGNTTDLLQKLLNRRIEASRLREGPVPTLSYEVAQQLKNRFGSDVRAIEHYLYEQVQTQVVRHGEMRFID